MGFRGDIQGLRAIAVASVVLYHAGIPFLSGGYVGVDIFFVISGFLITSHLLAGIERDGRVRFASFYARRARRILPASFLVLAATAIATAIVLPPLQRVGAFQDAIATALYVPNYLFAVQGNNYLAETAPSAFQHYWSLGVEEQFYLIWPAVLGLLFFLVRSRKAIGALLVVLVVVSFVLCVFLTYRSQPWAFFSLPTRAWELGIGGLVAYVVTVQKRTLSPRVAPVVGWLGVTGILASVLLFNEETPFPGYTAALPVLATAMVICAGATVTTTGPGWILSRRPMLFIGLISYSLYLVHWPALVIPQAAVGYETPLPLAVTVAIALACVPLAWLLYKFVEDPARKWSWLARARPRRSLLTALAASLIVVIVGGAGIAVTRAIPLASGRSAPQTVAEAPPQFTEFVPSNVTPSLWTVEDDNPPLYADGCHRSFDETTGEGCRFGADESPTIALFGDSHAAQWFPALLDFATANGYAVETYTKSSCPSVDLPLLRNGVPYTACDTWRANVIADMQADPPMAVLLANFGVAEPVDRTTDYTDAWGAGLRSMVEQLQAFTSVGLIADTPNMGETPSLCLSAHLEDTRPCERAASEALSAPTRQVESEVADELLTMTIDLTPFFCSDVCSPIIGNEVVYRDSHHMTATFSSSLSGALGDQLTAQLPQGSGTG
ncbi:acyltransferase [Herbiconiux moechotypicola]|uniref:acyltransferase family protein n=1 Tax=Herbiconiux moechotypicola TaxID=637393 RepID=UPI00217D691F|nr:acyltransferase family protein [Herbiconiux moechotypicola]MCS5731497.1 acyltransferase [Herbiconiux moechotypicola]